MNKQGPQVSRTSARPAKPTRRPPPTSAEHPFTAQAHPAPALHGRPRHRNQPFGTSHLDRLVIAAARELASLQVCCNVVNPGPVDTGWMTDELRTHLLVANPRGRLGQPDDTAALVSFLCSADGGWINGQPLHSDGGLHA